VDYSEDTIVRSAYIYWNLPFNRKHNKKVIVYIYGKLGFSATLKIYTDGSYSAILTETVSLTDSTGDLYINPDGGNVYIFDMDYYITNLTDTAAILKRKFNYRNIMFELSNISGDGGAEIHGVDFISAIIGG
jgi:hypothetical protein